VPKKTVVHGFRVVMPTLAALLFAAMYLATALPRVFYPYDLDFIEDSQLMQALRFAQGQPVFVAPNADFNPHVYMPLYTWLGGWLLKITGPSLTPLRLLSFAATLTTALLLYWAARRESDRRWIGLVGAGLWLGGYRLSGFWYELARVDALFVALALSGFAVGLYARRSTWGLIISAFLLALAFFAKQTALIVGVGLAMYLFISVGRRAWLFTLIYLSLVTIPLFTLNAVTGGWFFYHVFRLAAGDPVEIKRVIHYAGFEVFGLMAGLSLMTMLTLLLGVRRAGLKFLLEQPWLPGIGLAAVISGIGRASVGGSLNNLMPVYAFLCLAPALLVGEWNRRSLSPAWSRWRDWLVAALVLVQLALGAYYPPRYIPSAAMRASGDRLIQRLAAIDGPVLVMMHPYYALRAGKEPATQIAALWYVRERGQRPLPDDFASRIENRYYSAIVSDESLFETEPALQRLIRAHYYPAQTLGLEDAPTAPTGMAVTPQIIYLPRQP